MKNVILIGTEEDMIFELNRAGYSIKGYFGIKKKHYLKFLGTITKIENYIKLLHKTKICIVPVLYRLDSLEQINTSSTKLYACYCYGCLYAILVS